MTIETRTEDRKALAKALAEELGTEARYMGVPSCAYQVGGYTVNKDGSISGEDFEPIRDFLIRNGYIEETLTEHTEEEPAENAVDGMSVSIPIREFAAPALINLLRTLYSPAETAERHDEERPDSHRSGADRPADGREAGHG